MSNNKTKHVRIFSKDAELFKLVGLKISAEIGEVVSSGEIINALLQYANGNGEITADEISRKLEPIVRATG